MVLKIFFHHIHNASLERYKFYIYYLQDLHTNSKLVLSQFTLYIHVYIIACGKRARCMYTLSLPLFLALSLSFSIISLSLVLFLSLFSYISLSLSLVLYFSLTLSLSLSVSRVHSLQFRLISMYNMCRIV